MSNLIDAINAARGISTRQDPSIEAQRRLEAKTKLSDYAVTNAEVRPIVSSGLTLAELRRLVEKHRLKVTAAAVAK